MNNSSNASWAFVICLNFEMIQQRRRHGLFLAFNWITKLPCWVTLTYCCSLQLNLHEKCFSLLCRTCSSSTNPAQFQFETYAHIFVSFLCSALLCCFLFSVFCFLGNQGDFDKRIANQTNERAVPVASCQFFLLLFAANVRAWVTLEQAVKSTFSCVCVLCTLKCLEACFGFDLSCATLRMRNFNYVQQLSSSVARHMASWSDLQFDLHIMPANCQAAVALLCSVAYEQCATTER